MHNKPNKDNSKLAALLQSRAKSAVVDAPPSQESQPLALSKIATLGNPSGAKFLRLNLSFYQSDADRIREIIVAAAKLGVTMNSSQALRFAIRHCQLDRATPTVFQAILEEDGRRHRRTGTATANYR